MKQNQATGLSFTAGVEDDVSLFGELSRRDAFCVGIEFFNAKRLVIQATISTPDYTGVSLWLAQ